MSPSLPSLPSLLLLLLLSISASLTNLSSQAGFQEMNIWILPEFDDLVLDAFVLEERESGTERDCYLLCAASLRCVSMFHHRRSGLCRLLSSRHYVSEGARPQQGWRYLLLETDKRCPAKQGYIHLRDKGLCYALVFQTGATRSTAIQRCGRSGAHLMRIDSQEKQDIVVNQILSSNATAVNFKNKPGSPRGYYIDGQFLNSSWVLDSIGQEMTYSKWYPGEDTPIRSQKYAMLGADFDWQWVSVNSVHIRSYVCEVDMQ